ncbi:MAG: outer rane efflux protein [Verrucomicrobia bacterium]|nr:outer rane efflux protein [Verrucomicrobiota bacterium]
MKSARLLSHAVTSLAVFALGLAAANAQPTPAAPVPDTLDLRTAIGFALRNNFAIRQARERIKQQEGIVIEIRAREIPNVDASGAYQRNDTAIAQAAPPSDRYWSVSLLATQNLFAGGGIRSSIKSSELARDAALLDLKAVINDALLDVRASFYTVLLTREKITVQEKNLDLLQQQLKNVSNRFEAGTVSSFEKLRAEVAVANAQVPLITARNDYRLAIESLRQALGFTGTRQQDLNKVPNFPGTLDYTPVTFDLASAFDSAQANRPDLQRLAKLASAREQSVTTARSTYYPSVQAFGGYELRKGSTNAFGDSKDGWLLGLQSNWAIFDGRATSGRVAQARSLLEQSRLSLTEAELNTEVEVRRAYSSWQQATELADASRKVVSQAEEAVRLATARYDAGTATQLDVLQAQVDLTTARINQLQAYYAYNIAVASLRRAMGQPDEFVTE